MARIPQGGELIENKVSKAPGFMIGNVIVMAGVPSIMQAMLDGVAPTAEDRRQDAGRDASRPATCRKGIYAADLGDIAERHAGRVDRLLSRFVDGRFRNQIVLRSKDEAALRGRSRRDARRRRPAVARAKKRA